MDESKFGWFNQFSMLFEVVSAYAGVGLSLGIPTENFSFSGSLKTGSKLILILVMLRGRHRDLPMSIDRASESPLYCGLAHEDADAMIVLLPEEFSQAQSDAKGRHIIHDEIVAQRLEDEASLMSEREQQAREEAQAQAGVIPRISG
jgi:hypothetical protein